MADEAECPDSHRVLRLSLTKQRQRRSFIKSRKDAEKGMITFDISNLMNPAVAMHTFKLLKLDPTLDI